MFLTKDGRAINLHESFGGIYVGDYNEHVNLQKSVSYKLAKFTYAKAKYSELANVIKTCCNASKDGEILVECPAMDFVKRKKQIEKLNFEIIKTNFEFCDSDISSCYMVVTAH